MSKEEMDRICEETITELFKDHKPARDVRFDQLYAAVQVLTDSIPENGHLSIVRVQGGFHAQVRNIQGSTLLEGGSIRAEDALASCLVRLATKATK